VNDQPFAEFLALLRVSTPTQKVIDDALGQCYVTPNEVSDIIAESLIKKEALTILTSHREERDMYNTVMLKNLFPPEDVIDIPCISWCKKAPSMAHHPDLKGWLADDNFHELPAVAIGARVLNTRTQKDGRGRLVANGSIGTVTAIRKSKKQGYVTRIDVLFDDDPSQTPFGFNMNHCKSFDHLTHRVTKKTFTLVLAYAMTIHKSQGCTLRNKTLVHLRGVFAYGQTYVALSRTDTRANLRIVNGIASSTCLPIPADFR
jgi:ATP-dependent exoDNAse (exonuclease V) alpha subunit